MIQLKTGDLLASNAQTLVNTVNCVGIMGKGIALAFKRKYPSMYRDYVQRCSDQEIQPGNPYLYKDGGHSWILNFPTKKHWKSSSRISYIDQGLELLVSNYRQWGIESIAVPPLGCGNGGLDWLEVGPIIYNHLVKLEIPVELFLPPDVIADEVEMLRLSARSEEPAQVQLPLGLADDALIPTRRSA